MSGDIALHLADEPAVLMAERALYLPRRGALVVADTHWGKPAAFRAAAIPVPGGVEAADLERLDRALERSGAARLIVLGDLLHARAGVGAATLGLIGAWRERWPGLPIDLVRGNHDRGAGDPPATWGVACHDGPLEQGPLALLHEPREVAGRYSLAGHLHPVALLAGPGRQRERLPCFQVGLRRAVLPAFGSFTGGATARPLPGDRFFAVAGDAVVEVGR